MCVAPRLSESQASISVCIYIHFARCILTSCIIRSENYADIRIRVRRETEKRQKFCQSGQLLDKPLTRVHSYLVGMLYNSHEGAMHVKVLGDRERRSIRYLRILCVCTAKVLHLIPDLSIAGLTSKARRYYWLCRSLFAKRELNFAVILYNTNCKLRELNHTNSHR